MKKALNLFSLAFQGVCRKRRSSILVFSVLLVSFAFSIVSLSLVGSISKTNAQFRQMNYGAWYFGIPSGKPEDAQWLKSQSWAETVGTAQNYGTVRTNSGAIGFGTVDEALIGVGNLRVEKGHWPMAENEIALEAWMLSELGYDYSLGQEITLTVRVPVGESEIGIERNYTVCGIMHEYCNLWRLNHNKENRTLVGAVVTQSAAEAVLEAVRECVVDPDEVMPPVPQYFISVAKEDRMGAQSTLKNYFTITRTESFMDIFPCENTVAYPQWVQPQPDTFYNYMIAIVASLAVLCVYIMQIPSEVKSYATLRSIGITKLQLACLLLLETLLLCIPAMALGIPLGMGLTWLALRLLMYSGSVAIQVAMPYGMLAGVIALWIGAALLSRLVVLLVTVSTPLVGKFQLQASKARRTKRLRSTLTFFLLVAFVFTVMFSGLESLSPMYKRQWYIDTPAYQVYAKKPLSQGTMELLSKIPGVLYAHGVADHMATLTFDEETESIPMWMYVLDEVTFEDALGLDEDLEKYRAGELFVLFVPDNGKVYDLPERTITLEVEVSIPGEQGKTVISSGAMPYSLRILKSGEYHNRSLAFANPYSVGVSRQYMEKFLAQLPEGAHWEIYTGGEPYGYETIYLTVDNLNLKDLSTDAVLAELCARQGLRLINLADMLSIDGLIQEYTQELILLYTAGASIALVLLMILASTVSLEAEQEKKYYHTLRVIGMSRRQIWSNVCLKAIGRVTLSMVAGWCLWCIYYVVFWKGKDPDASIVTRLEAMISTMNGYGMRGATAVLFFAGCFGVLLAVCLLAKGKLRKGVESV